MSTPGIPMRIGVDYVHDLAFGLFPGAVVGAWVLRWGFESAGFGEGLLGRAAGGLWLVLILGVVLSVGTGLMRLRYWKAPVSTDAVESKIQTATIKHVLFVFTLLAAAFVLYAL